MASQQPSILIVAGEASADVHGARVLAALREERPDIQVFGIGGEAMRREGLEAVARAEDIAVAGLTEVLFALPRILGIMRRLERLARERRPSIAVLIDLPDFNLRLAKKLKALGIPVVYYISPQVWAWRKGRIKYIRKVVDRMLVILPFEEEFYRQHGVAAEFVGHPLVEQLPEAPDPAAARGELRLPLSPGPTLALLPGSRHKEVTRHLSLMLAGVRELQAEFPDVRVVIPVASTIARELVYVQVQHSGVPATIVEGHATEVLTAADAAIVCSGTATLQAGLLGRPMVVVYRVSWLTFQIVRRLVSVAHIALVNLIAGRALVPELVQKDFTPKNVAAELRRILGDAARRTRIAQELADLRRVLGGTGTAKRVVKVLLGLMPARLPNAAEQVVSQERSAMPLP